MNQYMYDSLSLVSLLSVDVVHQTKVCHPSFICYLCLETQRERQETRRETDRCRGRGRERARQTWPE